MKKALTFSIVILLIFGILTASYQKKAGKALSVPLRTHSPPLDLLEASVVELSGFPKNTLPSDKDLRNQIKEYRNVSLETSNLKPFDSEILHYKRETTIPSSPAGTITVTGRFMYYDYQDAKRPLAQALVSIYDDEDRRELVYARELTVTDVDGYFASDPFPNDDGPGEDGLDIVVRVWTDDASALVWDSNKNIYFHDVGPFLDCPDGLNNIGEHVPTMKGPWIIYSGVTAGWNYLRNTVGYQARVVHCCWPFEDWPHFHSGDDPETPFNDIGEIHLPEWAVQRPYDPPDIILHEYAHYIMFRLYGDNLPQTLPHRINQTSNAVTAWVEGWADFFP